MMLNKISKICIDCGEAKSIGLFYNRRDSVDGHHNYCKVCHTKRNQVSVRKWQQSQKGKEDTSRRNKLYKKNNPDKLKEYLRSYLPKYRMTPQYIKYHREWDRSRRNNPEFRLYSNISRTIRKSMQFKQGGSWTKLVDYTLAELITHIENQFDGNMTWDNYGSYWHIDHILPRSFFNLNDPGELKKCWSLNNLRPLEANYNILKSDKLEVSYNNFINFVDLSV